MQNILYPALALAAYFGLHLFLFASIVRFFGISGAGAQRSVLIVILALSFGFFLSALLGRQGVSLVATAMSWVSSFWMGLLVYMTIGFMVIWTLWLGLEAAGLGWSGRLPLGGALVVVLALAVSLTGLFLGQNPTVRNVTVRLPGLPEAWEGKTLVHLSDLHLGLINRTGFLQKVVDQVNSLEAEAIVITGDLFDGMGSQPGRFVPQLKKLSSARGTFFVTGNHEHYLGLEAPLAALAETDIWVIDDQVHDLDGLQLVGLGFPGFAAERPYQPDIITRLPGYSRQRPSILLYHEPTSVTSRSGNGSSRNGLYFSPDIDFTVQKESGIDLQLSGHTHAGQFWPFTWLTKLIFKGYHWGLNRQDNFQIYVSSGVGTWGPPLRLGARGEIVALTLKSE